MSTHGRLLVAYSIDSTHIATTREYLEAFGRYSDWDVSYVNVTGDIELRFDLNDFDAVLQSYGARLYVPGYVSSRFREAIRRFRGVRALAVQDEYDRTDLLRQAIRDDGFHLVLTCVPPAGIEYVYPSSCFPETNFISVLTGYVPNSSVLSRRGPLSDRPITIGYRGRDIGLRYGRLGFDKLEIGRRMREICEARGISHDIEWTEGTRIYGDAWYAFVRSCRVMLGSESGSNVFDFDGSIERAFQQLKQSADPLDRERFLALTDSREQEISMGQISPRIFEAAAQWTPMVLLKGCYSGAIRPGEHYIELSKDFSNADDVLRQIEDLDALEAMATRAYDHLIGSGDFSYRRFVHMVLKAIGERHRRLPSAVALRESPFPLRSEGHANFLTDSDLTGEYPTASPKGVVYSYYKLRALALRTLQDERVALLEEHQRLISEIERLNDVYGREIGRLDDVYGREIGRLNDVYGREIERLNTVLQSESRRLQEMIGFVPAIRRAGAILSQAIRHPRRSIRGAKSFVRSVLSGH
jgi:hypothetical protein